MAQRISKRREYADLARNQQSAYRLHATMRRGAAQDGIGAYRFLLELIHVSLRFELVEASTLLRCARPDGERRIAKTESARSNAHKSSFTSCPRT